MTLVSIAHELLKIISRHQSDFECFSSVAELELPIDTVRVVDVLPLPGGKVVQFVTRFDGAPVEFSTEPGTETHVEHSSALVQNLTKRLRLEDLQSALLRIVLAWDTLQPCEVITSSKHSPAYLIEAIADARKLLVNTSGGSLI